MEVFPAFQVFEYRKEFTRASLTTVTIRIRNGTKAHFTVDKVDHFGKNIRVNSLPCLQTCSGIPVLEVLAPNWSVRPGRPAKEFTLEPDPRHS